MRIAETRCIPIVLCSPAVDALRSAGTRFRESMIRHAWASMLIVGLVGARATAQQPDSAAVIHTFVVPPRARGNAKHEAEQRRRRVDFIDAKTWSTQEWSRFLDGLPPTLSPAQLAELDASFHLTGTANGEIAMRWYPLTVRSDYRAARPQIASFLGGVGRRKLIMPTYAALVKTQDGLAFAKQIFAQAKPGYHPITSASLQALLDAAKSEQ